MPCTNFLDTTTTHNSTMKGFKEQKDACIYADLKTASFKLKNFD
jgi:hypothetical protein